MSGTVAEADTVAADVRPRHPLFPPDSHRPRDVTSRVRGRLLSPAPPSRPRSPFIPTSIAESLNLVRVAGGLALSLASRKPFVWGAPVVAMIEPTSLCNLKCPLCPSGNGSLTRERSRLDLETFQRIVDRLPRSVRLLQLWNQGEPYIVRDLDRMISYARGVSDWYIVTSTNGHYFRSDQAARRAVESGISEIIVSLDGATQTTYQRYRVGGQLDVVLDGVRRLTKAKRVSRRAGPVIHLQFILMRHNQHERERMIQLGRDVGADRISFKTLQVTGFEGGEEFLPADPSLTRYSGRTEDGRFITRKRRFFPEDCLRLWHSVVVNCDGRVSPCCFDKDGDFAMGNLLENSFEEIWTGDAYQRFRRQLLAARYGHEMCRDCTEGVPELFRETIDYSSP